jgi:hypothetical protein
MDRQLAHITEARAKNPQSWDGSAVGPMFIEMKGAWRKFSSALIPPNRLTLIGK